MSRKFKRWSQLTLLGESRGELEYVSYTKSNLVLKFREHLIDAALPTTTVKAIMVPIFLGLDLVLINCKHLLSSKIRPSWKVISLEK